MYSLLALPFRSLRFLVFCLSTVLISGTQPASADWELTSENRSSGITAYATVIWVDGYGAVPFDRFFQSTYYEGTLWSSLTLICSRKTLTASFNVQQSGSGNQSITLDDPGYISVLVDGVIPKRFRTYGTDYESSITIKQDAKSFAATLMNRKALSTTFKYYPGKKINVRFDITGLAKAKTRFKYAGCTI